MSKPVYLSFCIQGFTEAWYQLSKEEQDKVWAKNAEINERAGAKWIIACDSRWANEGTFAWGVLEYPDMDTCQKAYEENEKLGWWRYFSVKSILGTKMVE
jgi:hypothetical protein